MKQSERPEFGMLNGVKVFLAGTTIAGPFAAQLMAHHGADVIWQEYSKGLDAARYQKATGAELDRQNFRSICFDTSTPEGKDIFKRIVADVDIFIENSKPGQYEKWGLGDEALWEINPKLVIAHHSGYGQTGEPSYIGRSAYDLTIQAFAGLVYANTLPGEEFQRTIPGQISDYMSGFFGAFSCLAAYIKAQQTGKGESMDIAQYEAVMYCSWEPVGNALSGLAKYLHNPYGNAVGLGGFVCKDGNKLYMCAGGPGGFKGLMKTIGMEDEYGSEDYPVGFGSKFRDQPGGERLQERVVEYLSNKTAAEAERELAANGVPCSQIMQYDQMWEHPQYQARESLIKFNTRKGVELVGPNIVPKLKNNPGRMFRPCPSIGEDSSDILSDLGYSQAEVQQLLDSKIVVQTKDY